MTKVPNTLRSTSAPISRRRVLAGLWAKEWHEQRWRLFLGTIVLGGLLGGLLRAQIMPPHESALLIYWPTGMVLVIFLAMGSVAAERAERTWEFLLAQPVTRGDVLLAKWAWGLMQWVTMMVAATAVGLVALRSRDPYAPWMQLFVFALISTVSLSCWYTVLFLVLSRARNEFTAAIGGVLLTIAVHAWLLQFVAGYPLIGVVLNPVIGMAAVVAPQGPYGPHGPHVAFNLWWLLWLVPLQVIVWIVLPIGWVLFRERRGGHL